MRDNIKWWRDLHLEDRRRLIEKHLPGFDPFKVITYEEICKVWNAVNTSVDADSSVDIHRGDANNGQ